MLFSFIQLLHSWVDKCSCLLPHMFPMPLWRTGGFVRRIFCLWDIQSNFNPEEEHSSPTFTCPPNINLDLIGTSRQCVYCIFRQPKRSVCTNWRTSHYEITMNFLLTVNITCSYFLTYISTMWEQLSYDSNLVNILKKYCKKHMTQDWQFKALWCCCWLYCHCCAADF